MKKALVVLLSFMWSCAAETPPPRGASSGAGSGAGPVASPERPAAVDLCRRLGQLYACHARSLAEPERAKFQRGTAFMLRLTKRMPYATAQHACRETLVSFARAHVKTPGMARCVHPGSASKTPPLAPLCRRIVTAIRCYNRGRPTVEKQSTQKLINAMRGAWQKVPVEGQSFLCRRHFLVWAFKLPTGALGRCRPTEAALREPPMPLPPANLQPACKRYLASYRCMLKHLKGAPLWYRRDDLRQALQRWHAMPHLLPRLCVLSAARLKMQLASAKLTTVCPAP